jgi:hypothetical protein
MSTTAPILADSGRMAAADRTWIVLIRDISHAVRIDGLSTVVACLVLDADTGLAVGLSVGPDPAQACSEAVEHGLSGSVVPIEPAPPTQLVCAPELVDTVQPQVRRVLPANPPEIVPATVGPEAEDIFDSLVGHLAGRSQPEQPPLPDDWQALFRQVYELSRAEPWTRWPDDTVFDLEVTVDGEPTRYAAAIIGRQGIQRGLALYPGGALPDLHGWNPGQPPPVPTGTLLCHLDPMSESPPDQVARATRYGWPVGAALAPVLFAMVDDGPADLSARDVHHLIVAARAVLSHSPGTGASTGSVPLPDQHEGTFAIS